MAQVCGCLKLSCSSGRADAEARYQGNPKRRRVHFYLNFKRTHKFHSFHERLLGEVSPHLQNGSTGKLDPLCQHSSRSRGRKSRCKKW